jgi:hypothetical protein
MIFIHTTSRDKRYFRCPGSKKHTSFLKLGFKVFDKKHLYNKSTHNNNLGTRGDELYSTNIFAAVLTLRLDWMLAGMQNTVGSPPPHSEVNINSGNDEVDREIFLN